MARGGQGQGRGTGTGAGRSSFGGGKSSGGRGSSSGGFSFAKRDSFGNRVVGPSSAASNSSRGLGAQLGGSRQAAGGQAQAAAKAAAARQETINRLGVERNERQKDALSLGPRDLNVSFTEAANRRIAGNVVDAVSGTPLGSLGVSAFESSSRDTTTAQGRLDQQAQASADQANTITGSSLGDKAANLAAGFAGPFGKLATTVAKNVNLTSNPQFISAPTDSGIGGLSSQVSSASGTSRIDTGVSDVTDTSPTPSAPIAPPPSKPKGPKVSPLTPGIGIVGSSLSGRTASFVGAIAVRPKRTGRGRV